MYLMIFFLCIELKKILVSETFFKFNKYFFSTGTPTTNKLDDGMLLHKTDDSISVTQQNSIGF